MSEKLFIVHAASKSGGKAGKGRNKTSTVQVRCDSCVVKQFRYVVGDPASTKAAYDKAGKYAERMEAAIENPV